jgi:hypothetical protein
MHLDLCTKNAVGETVGLYPIDGSLLSIDRSFLVIKMRAPFREQPFMALDIRLFLLDKRLVPSE